MKFFRDHFSRLISHAAGKAVIFLLASGYLAIAIWGCTSISQGLQLQNLAPDDSYVADFYEAEQRYFAEYDFQVQVVVHSSIDNKQKADKVNELIDTFERHTYFRGSDLTKSWLRDYEDYAADNGYSIDYTDIFTTQFDQFLQQTAYAEYSDDVRAEDNVFCFILMSKISEET